MKNRSCAMATGVLLSFISSPGFTQADMARVERESAASFTEDFASGSLDPSRWAVSDGWANGSHQLCTWSSRNVSLADGALVLSLTNTPLKDRKFSCAEIQTKGRYGYGTYEIRMQAAESSGIVSAFFTYIGPPHRKPHDEIDFEFLGKSRRTVQLNYYAGGKGDHEKLMDLDFDASGDMHDYAFVWAPDALHWYIDGRRVHTVKADPAALPQNPSKIYLSLWNGNAVGWLGRFTDPGQPLVMKVERVAFTARGDPCQFPQSIVCGMEDPDGSSP